LGSKQSFV